MMNVARTPREEGRRNADPPVSRKSGAEHEKPRLHGAGLSIWFNPDGRGGWKSKSAEQAKRILDSRASDFRQAVFASPLVKMNGSGL
jgi:hypothetical protein